MMKQVVLILCWMNLNSDKFQFVEQNSVECWCDLGATLYRAILTIFTISNGIAKTPRDNFDFMSNTKNAPIFGAFFYLFDDVRCK